MASATLSMQRRWSIVVLGIASGEDEKRWRTSLSSILMSLGLKKRRPILRERESDRQRQSKELQQRAYLNPILYALSLNHGDMNRSPLLLHLARPRDNKRRIASAL